MSEAKCGLCYVWGDRLVLCEEHAHGVHVDGCRCDCCLPLLPALPEFTQLDVIAIPRRKTGVIVGSTTDSAEHCARMKRHLQAEFPEVRVVVVPHAQSVAFEWEVDE